MDKERLAILRLQEASQLSLAYYGAPLLLCDSGGKDSSALKQLAFNAKIPFEVLHNHTTADAPGTVHFIRSEFARLENRGVHCELGKPTYKGERVTMWSLIPQKRMPPTRKVRYCCSVRKQRWINGHKATKALNHRLGAWGSNCGQSCFLTACSVFP